MFINITIYASFEIILAIEVQLAVFRVLTPCTVV